MLALFLTVAVLHFVLSVAGLLVALPAGFETQGVGFRAAPGKSLLAAIAAVLLAPLAWLQPLLPERAGFSYVEIAAVSAFFGVAAVALVALARRLLQRGQ
jgi:hypothetical protein